MGWKRATAYYVTYRLGWNEPAHHGYLPTLAKATAFIRERGGNRTPFEIRRTKDDVLVDSGRVWEKGNGTKWLSHF